MLVLTSRGKKHLLTVSRGENFHTDEGVIELSGLIGLKYGSAVNTHTGKEWTILRPKLMDVILRFPRVTQILYPKDLGLVLLLGDIRPGSIVVEGGTGSGVLTTVLASHVEPRGKVYSYDVEEEHLESARKHLQRLGLSQYVELKLGNVVEGIDESIVDCVILDIPTPWLAVEKSYDALKGSGTWISLNPTIEQIIETVEELHKHGFVDISVSEILMRNLRVKRGMTRPEHLMRAHTAYIVAARKSLRRLDQKSRS